LRYALLVCSSARPGQWQAKNVPKLLALLAGRDLHQSGALAPPISIHEDDREVLVVKLRKKMDLIRLSKFEALFWAHNYCAELKG
jgi:hypothetical protein